MHMALTLFRTFKSRARSVTTVTVVGNGNESVRIRTYIAREISDIKNARFPEKRRSVARAPPAPTGSGLEIYFAYGKMSEIRVSCLGTQVEKR